MANKVVSVANIDAKKPRGKPFEKGNKVGKQFTGNADPRNNRSGQRSAAAVRTAAEMRELYVKVLHERGDELKPSPNATNMETIVRRHILSVVNGNADEREKLYDRIWGKAVAAIELSGKDGGAIQTKNVNVTDEARVDRIAALLDNARNRRDGRATE